MPSIARLIGLLLIVMPACCGRPGYRPEPAAAARIATVYVIDRGWHTDIGLGAGDVHGPLATLEADFPGVRYLVFGFGDRAYLLSPYRSAIDMIAALVPGRGAMLVTALRAPPAAAFGASHVVALGVTAGGLDRLNAFIWKDMSRAGRGPAVRIAAGPYPGSAFYAATATYDAFHTCNTWTAEALQAAGLPVSPAGVLFAAQLMARARAARN